jgi:hypothetical protein
MSAFEGKAAKAASGPKRTSAASGKNVTDGSLNGLGLWQVMKRGNHFERDGCDNQEAPDRERD